MRLSEAALDCIRLAVPDIWAGDTVSIGGVWQSGQLVQGSPVGQFKERFARYIGVQYTVAANSGTAALHLALVSHGVGPCDEVVTIPFPPAASPILFRGARTVFVDTDGENGILSTAGVEVAQEVRALRSHGKRNATCASRSESCGRETGCARAGSPAMRLD